jgi:hypothetical protein
MGTLGSGGSSGFGGSTASAVKCRSLSSGRPAASTTVSMITTSSLRLSLFKRSMRENGLYLPAHWMNAGL